MSEISRLRSMQSRKLELETKKSATIFEFAELIFVKQEIKRKKS